MKLLVTDANPTLTCVRGEGRITQAQLASSATQLLDAVGADCYSRVVLLDLERTTYLDSSGLGWLLINHKRFLEHGGKLVIYAVPPLVDQVVQLMKLYLVLNMAPDERSARALATGVTP